MCLTEREGVLYLKVKVQPRASKNEVSGVQGDSLKIRLTSPPVEGAANQLLIEFVAKKLNLTRSSVEITSGEKSRNKILRIEGTARAKLAELLNIADAGLTAS